jgi:hypothetical protein
VWIVGEGAVDWVLCEDEAAVWVLCEDEAAIWVLCEDGATVWVLCDEAVVWVLCEDGSAVWVCVMKRLFEYCVKMKRVGFCVDVDCKMFTFTHDRFLGQGIQTKEDKYNR